MCCTVMMLKSDETNDLIMQKKYITDIPMSIIKELATIEKRDWLLFRNSPYHMFGHYIYYNLNHYTLLKDYINKDNCRFEFIYEYITHHTPLKEVCCYKNGRLISKEKYLSLMHKKDYHERWLMIDQDSHQILIFFDYTHTASPCIS